MLNHVFSRIKLLFMLEMVDAKKNCESIVIAEDTLKESYSKILNPLKDSLSTNFKLVIDDMEHMKNSY